MLVSRLVHSMVMMMVDQWVVLMDFWMVVHLVDRMVA